MNTNISPIEVDAEQVELSFSQGDMITVYGVSDWDWIEGEGMKYETVICIVFAKFQPMDEDGFYLGELNGVRGLVPSNFLQPAQTLPDGMPASARPKGVAFSADLALAYHTPAVPWPQPKTATTRRIQPQQQPDGAGGRGPAAAARLTGATGMTSKVEEKSEDYLPINHFLRPTKCRELRPLRLENPWPRRVPI